MCSLSFLRKKFCIWSVSSLRLLALSVSLFACVYRISIASIFHLMSIVLLFPLYVSLLIFLLFVSQLRASSAHMNCMRFFLIRSTLAERDYSQSLFDTISNVICIVCVCRIATSFEYDAVFSLSLACNSSHFTLRLSFTLFLSA